MRLTNEHEIDDLLNNMTIEEKVSLCHGNSKFTISGIKRLNIDELTMSDGPHGVRSEMERDSWICLNRPEDKCTYLPTETALAATWNPILARKFGETLGSEARYRGKDIILAPGVNIIRTPLCGRNFEYLSEDPCLIQKMAPEIVKGIESQDTAACVKHFALNNQELDRGKVNVEVSKRALHEIYLKGFYSAIIEGGASCVMGAYNKYKNEHMCHNKYLVNDVLKKDWGFKGVYLSDWGGAHSTEESIFNGLDIEMGTNKPYDEYYLANEFIVKAKNNKDARDILDDKVRRILRLMFSVKKFEADRLKGEFNTQSHQQTAYEIAAEGMVLLKNDDDVLPIKISGNKKILVLGPNADTKHSIGGSSSGVQAKYEITPLKGIINRLMSDACKVEYQSTIINLEYKTIPLQTLNIIDTDSGCRNFKKTCYTLNESGNIIFRQIEYCNTADINNGTYECYDIECSIKIPESGIYSFKFSSNCTSTVKINGKQSINIQYDYWRNIQDATSSIEYEKGTTVCIQMHIKKADNRNVDFSFGWLKPSDYSELSSEKNILEKAKDSDYVIYCGGLDHSFDTESVDKRSMMLPFEQNMLIEKLLKINEKTIIVLTAGSPVELPWIKKARSVLWTWYAGMETGNVLADILTGKVCPSGKMPFTMPYEYSDTPVARYGEYQSINCKYNEGILVGYRGYEYDNIDTLFSFGHGLSYSEFLYSKIEVIIKANIITVTCCIKNVGKVAAKEVVQLYIGDNECCVVRPIKELKDFKKVELCPNEEKKVILSVKSSELAYYDEKTDKWKLEHGEFTAYLASSSKDVRLKKVFSI